MSPDKPTPPDQGGAINETTELGNATTQDQDISAAAEKQVPPLCPKCKIPVIVYADGSVICDRCLTGWSSVDEMLGKRRTRPRPKLKVQEFLASLMDQLAVIKRLMPDSLFAERLQAHQLSGEQIARLIESITG